jgi:hypothetical protein
MKRNDAFPSKYLSKEDVKGEPKTGVIDAVIQETFEGDDGKKLKPILTFSNDVKPMVLNNANWMTIEDAYGDESDMWKGKKIELYHDPSVMFGNKRVGGVRVRVTANAAQAKQTVSPVQRWIAWRKDNEITDDNVIAALGTVKPSEWIEKNAGKTIEDAINVVEAQLFGV